MDDTSPPAGHFAQGGGASATGDPPPPSPGNFIVKTRYKDYALPVPNGATFATYVEVYPHYVPQELDIPYADGVYLTATNRVDNSVEFVVRYRPPKYNDLGGFLLIYDWSCNASYPCYNESGEPKTSSSFVWDARLPEVPCWYKMLEDNTRHYVNYLYYYNSTYIVSPPGLPVVWRNAVTIYNWCTRQYDGVYTHDFVPQVEIPGVPAQVDCSLPYPDDPWGCGDWAGSIELLGNGVQPPAIVKQGFHHQLLIHDGQYTRLTPDVTEFINNSAPLWQLYYLYPNSTWEVGTYQDDDGDDVPNSTDHDIDGDGVNNWVNASQNDNETKCGATAASGELPEYNPYVRPEREDGAFAGQDDDGDTQIDEALPAAAMAYDCDGDGYKGRAEAVMPLCGNGINDDDKVYTTLVPDDGVVDDGCPGGPAQAGAFSEAQFSVGTNDQDPCGTNGWPADLVSGGLPDSTNRLNILDMTSFLAPVRRLDTAPGNPAFDDRWDLVPGRVPFNNMINVVDLTSLFASTTGYPSMLNEQRAFNGPPCPWLP